MLHQLKSTIKKKTEPDYHEPESHMKSEFKTIRKGCLKPHGQQIKTYTADIKNTHLP